jgi:hypothetical protein
MNQLDSRVSSLAMPLLPIFVDVTVPVVSQSSHADVTTSYSGEASICGCDIFWENLVSNSHVPSPRSNKVEQLDSIRGSICPDKSYCHSVTVN